MAMISILLKLVKLYLLVVLFAWTYNFYLRRKGFKGVSYFSLLKPNKLLSVLWGLLIKLLLPSHVFEQLVLRVYDPYCRKKCLQRPDGRCHICGCDAYAKMMSPFEQDSADNWGPIIFSRKQYAKLREEYPVSIYIRYKRKNQENGKAKTRKRRVRSKTNKG